MSTTGARYGSKIDSTVDRQAPYAWTLGDGSTIAGLELAIIGDESAGVPPMLPGGVRRVIIPSKLAYEDLAKPNKNSLQVQDCSTGRGPIPPNSPQKASDMGAGEFQRFKNICEACLKFGLEVDALSAPPSLLSSGALSPWLVLVCAWRRRLQREPALPAGSDHGCQTVWQADGLSASGQATEHVYIAVLPGETTGPEGSRTTGESVS